MKPRAFRLATLALATVGAAATLTACGGATVDSDDVKGSETAVTETSQGNGASSRSDASSGWANLARASGAARRRAAWRGLLCSSSQSA